MGVLTDPSGWDHWFFMLQRKCVIIAKAIRSDVIHSRVSNLLLWLWLNAIGFTCKKCSRCYVKYISYSVRSSCHNVIDFYLSETDLLWRGAAGWTEKPRGYCCLYICCSLLRFWFCFWDQVLLRNYGWSGIHHISQTSLELGHSQRQIRNAIIMLILEVHKILICSRFLYLHFISLQLQHYFNFLSQFWKIWLKE